MPNRLLWYVLQFIDALVGDEIPHDRDHVEIRFGVADVSDAERPILEAITRYKNGVLIDLRRMARGSIETVHDDHLARRLSAIVLKDGRPMQIRQSGTATTVLIGGVEPTGSTGLVTIAGAAIVPFLKVVRAHELAVVVYDQEVLDPDQGHLLWDIYSEHLEGTSLGSLRRLVLVSESAWPHHDLHLRAPGKSANITLFSNQVTRRRTWQETVSFAREVLADECCVFFLAAGFSASSRPMPLGNALRDHAIHSVVGELEGRPNFAAYRSRLRDQGLLTDLEYSSPLGEWVDQLTFERVMKWQLPDAGNDPMRLPAMRKFVQLHGEAMTSLGSSIIGMRELLQNELVKRGRRTLVPVTINFDELLETDSGLPIDIFATEADFASAIPAVDAWLDGSSSRIPYLKLHGTISDSSSLVISTTQTDLLLSDTKRAVLNHLAAKRPRWIYIGASMRDRDLYTTFADFDVNEDWVSPSSAPTVVHFCNERRVERWAQRHQRSIYQRMHSLTADGFLRALTEAAGII